MDELARESPFDLLLTDTSLFQSLTAAIQCGRGKKVLQIDENAYYGGPEAGSHKISLPSGDSFIFDPSPIVFYARGPLADLLLDLDLTEYIDFMAIEQQFIWPSQQVLIALPFSKEQVMLEPALTLLEKRKLSKLLGLAAVLAVDAENGPSSSLADLLAREQVPPESRVFQLIAYGACRCASFQEISQLSIKSAVESIETLRASINHLSGQSPFVVPLWGSSELSQAACRKAAVSGAIQILGKSLTDVQEAQISFKNKVEKCSQVPSHQNRKAFLLDRPILGINGTALVTVPPACDLNPQPEAPAINILQLTSDSNCCPSGTWLIYLWSAGSLCEEIEQVLIDPLSRILWSSAKQYETLPHYDSEANVPFQPLFPASFQAEFDFAESFKSFNKL